jgi:hypothetical protein
MWVWIEAPQRFEHIHSWKDSDETSLLAFTGKNATRPWFSACNPRRRVCSSVEMRRRRTSDANEEGLFLRDVATSSFLMLVF